MPSLTSPATFSALWGALLASLVPGVVLSNTSPDGILVASIRAARLGQSWPPLVAVLPLVAALLAAVLIAADLAAVGVPVRLAAVEVPKLAAGLVPALLPRVVILFHAAARALDRTSARARGGGLSRPVLAELAHATSHQVLSCP